MNSCINVETKKYSRYHECPTSTTKMRCNYIIALGYQKSCILLILQEIIMPYNVYKKY